jgi:ABC-type transport system involved in multi-copper enzyme maturation permease subunit
MTVSAEPRKPRAVTRQPAIAWHWGGLYVHLTVVILLFALGPFVDARVLASLWGVYALAVVVLFYRSGGSLLGPVFFYDLVRTSRQGRHIVLRCAYAVLLLSVLFVIYYNRFGGRVQPLDLFGAVSISKNELPNLVAAFFSGFLGAQMAVVFVLTPVYVAGAIAEERERRTLEFLLTTHLTDREIVFGKLASRLGNLLLLLLTGLPIFGIMQVLGGVEPELVLAGFAATAATMLSVGSLSILVSVLTRHTLAAVFRTYIYLVLALSVGACIPVFNFGHPIIAIERLRVSLFTPGVADSALVVARDYVLAHLFYTVVCLGVAVAQLRPASLRSAEPAPVENPAASHPAASPEPAVPARLRPAVGEHALLWKEMYVEQEFRWERVHPLLAVLLLFAGVCTAAVGLTIVVVGVTAGVSVMGPMHVWMQVVGTTVLGLVYVLVGFYAACSISRERERQTLDSLLTVPESVDAILHAKWLGSMLSVRQIYPLLGAVYGLALVTGGLSPLAVPLVAITAGSYLLFVAGLGLYCSVVCGGTMRATVYTLVGGLAVAGASWLAAENSHELLAAWLPPEAADGVTTFLSSGLSPPMPLFLFSFPLLPSSTLDPPPEPAHLLAALAGVLIYAAAGLVLRHLAVRRMRAAMR